MGRGAPQTSHTFQITFYLFAPLHDTTASHGSTFSHFDLTNDDLTVDTSHGTDRCGQQPGSFSADGKTQGRYHPTRPTTTYSHWWITPQRVLWWPPCPWDPLHHPHGTPPGLQQLEVHPSPSTTNHQGRARPHPTALLWRWHLQPFEYDIPDKLFQVHAWLLRCSQHLHSPKDAMSILQKAVCQTLSDAYVPKAPSSHRCQYLLVLLGMPPSSQWPRSHDPPWPMAEHNQGIRGCQHDPDPWPLAGIQSTLGSPIPWWRLWRWLCSLCLDSSSRRPSPNIPWGNLQPFLGQPTEPLAPYFPDLHRYPRPILYSRCQPIPKPYGPHLEEPIWQERWPPPVL